MKIKATFYKATVTKNAFQEDIHDWSVSFSTGCDIKSMRFTDTKFESQTRDGTQLFCTTRKNSNTRSVRQGDKVSIQGSSYIVRGVDPRVNDFDRIMFLLDFDEGSL